MHTHSSNSLTHERNHFRNSVSLLTCIHTHQTPSPTNTMTHELVSFYWRVHIPRSPTNAIIHEPLSLHRHVHTLIATSTNDPRTQALSLYWHAHTLVFVGKWARDEVVLKLIKITLELNHCLFSDMHTPTSRTQSPTNTITHELKPPRIPISVLTCTHTHRFGVIYLCYIYICIYV